MSTFVLYVETLWISPYVFSSFVALREKRASFDVVELALGEGAHRKPDYALPSVTGRVPSLDHEGFRLAESSAIAEYLEEIFPPPSHVHLLPADVRARARARQLMAWLRSDLGALREERATVTMFYGFDLEPMGEPAQRDAERLVQVAGQIVPPDGGPLFGEWSLIDAELAFMLHRLIMNGEPVPAKVAEYARGQWARPSVREFVHHARPAAVPPSYWAIEAGAAKVAGGGKGGTRRLDV